MHMKELKALLKPWSLMGLFLYFLTRTGSKLGISPLMLAAMNGHVPAVKLLLDMGSDINAQIETNRNTALTLACFQGRAEVVSLLLDRKANVEHRAKVRTFPFIGIHIKRVSCDLFCNLPAISLTDCLLHADWSYSSDGGGLGRLCRGWPGAARQRRGCQCSPCSLITRHCPHHCCRQGPLQVL